MARTAIILLLCWTCTLAASPEVRLSTGVVRGITEDGVRQFKGIPYVAPPVGELRWRAPQSVSAWEKPLDATDYGPMCPQMKRTRRGQAEDCLTLNVWTPAKVTAPLPVMVWIHGGAHVNGSGRTRGETFARDGIVLVSINYRLGRFGVFAHPELSSARPKGEPTGNFAVMDQIEALKWVQREISHFGGDPKRVTIFGVSAGGSYVNLLMASPLARGLFHGAIAQSGANGLTPMRDLDAQERLGISFLSRMKAKDMGSLRALPWEDLMDNALAYRTESSPVIDGQVISESVQRTFATGKQAKVPYIAGANSNEGSLARAIPIPAYKRIMQKNIEKVTEAYGLKSDHEDLPQIFYGDMLFVAPSRYLASRMQSADAPGWFYYFDYVMSSFESYAAGANHGAEVAYVFDRPRPLNLRPGIASRLGVPPGEYALSEEDREMARTVHGYWVQFARTGDPNGEELVSWPEYDSRTEPALHFANEGISVVDHIRDAPLDMIEAGILGEF